MPGLKSNKYSFFRTLLTKKFCWLPRKVSFDGTILYKPARKLLSRYRNK